MSKIEVTFNEGILKIEKKTARYNENNIEENDVNLLKYGKEYTSKIRASNCEEKNKILFFEKVDFGEEKIDEENEDKSSNNNGKENEKEKVEKKIKVILVYTINGRIKYIYSDMEKAFKKLVKIRYKVLKISINKKRVKLKVIAYILNKFGLEIGEQKIYIDKELAIPCTLKQYPKKISKIKMLLNKNIYTFKFNMDDILKDESTINGPVRFSIRVGEKEVNYKLAKRNKHIKNTQYYYNPMKGIYVKNFALHIRRSYSGCLVFVKRLKTSIEGTLRFKILESKIVSKTFYYIGKFLLHFRRKKINIFYEKFTSKVEEGAYDLFTLFQKYKNTKNYFIIDENSPDYNKIKENNGVVKKYSLKYYWVIYNSTNFIATEAPSHLNIIRSNNGIFRKCLADKNFIFLQHGVTYLKCHGRNSTFRKGKEGEVDYIVAGSEKEKDAIVDMLKIDEEQVLKTGLPIFSKIDYKHIKQDSDDYVTIMLTWKPYEEHLYNYEESLTYQNTMAVCEMLKKYISKDKIIIMSHPKAFDLISGTDLKDSLWKEPISKALEKTKLLITDYSSVCYNSFYQGSGVIFFQPDLELFEIENGKLVPNDDEYIGKRVFNIEDLENIIKDTIQNQKINLDKVRTKENEEMYKTINEFSDGKNIDRIYQELIKLDLI